MTQEHKVNRFENGEPSLEAVKETARMAQNTAPVDEEGRVIIPIPQQKVEEAELLELVDKLAENASPKVRAALATQSFAIGMKANSVVSKLIQSLISEVPYKLLVVLYDGKVTPDEIKQITELLTKIVVSTLQSEYNAVR